MKILILDDHTLFREGLKLLLLGLHEQLDIQDVDNLLAAQSLVAQNHFDLALIDLNLGEVNGLETLLQVRDQLKGTPIVVLSAERNSDVIHRAIEEGAMGFISKTATHHELLAAIKLILAGGVYLPKEVAAVRSTAARVDGSSSESEILSALSGRQREVLKYLLQGKPNKTISVQLNISENTVKAHLSAIFRALGARNRTEAVYFAARAGVPLD